MLQHLKSFETISLVIGLEIISNNATFASSYEETNSTYEDKVAAWPNQMSERIAAFEEECGEEALSRVEAARVAALYFFAHKDPVGIAKQLDIPQE